MEAEAEYTFERFEEEIGQDIHEDVLRFGTLPLKSFNRIMDMCDWPKDKKIRYPVLKTLVDRGFVTPEESPYRPRYVPMGRDKDGKPEFWMEMVKWADNFAADSIPGVNKEYL